MSSPKITQRTPRWPRTTAWAVVPARASEPRDKAKVETGVQIAERWILACLRNRCFFSLDELNDAIAELLERLNTRPFQKLEGCRRSRFEELERSAMRPLPARRYELALWKRAGVGIDYHVEYEGRYYSVPHPLIRAKVELRVTGSTVEILHRRQRIASHVRSYGPKGPSSAGATTTTGRRCKPNDHHEPT